MKYGKLILEKKDLVMIKRYQHMNSYIEDYSHQDALEMLEENMAKALVRDAEDMADDIIRLYSIVTVTSKSGWRETFQVVLPLENDNRANKFSVQCALGASVIGRSEGDMVRYCTPIGIIPLKITKVVQTEHKCATKHREGTINSVQAHIN
jgi:regulator of nucleoside diphosphate kinase